VQTPSQQSPSIVTPSSRVPKRQATPDTPAGHAEVTHSPRLSRAVPGGQAPASPLQLPFIHVVPDGQAEPQLPQLAAVVNPSTHSFEQHVPAPPSGRGHAAPEFPGPHIVGGPHVPLLHTLVATHACPQLPQLAGSDASSVQPSPQQLPHAAVKPPSALKNSTTHVIPSSPV
jgi:hypothetical protein